MKQNRESKSKPRHIWTTDFWKKCKDNSVEKGQLFQYWLTKPNKNKILKNTLAHIKNTNR